MHGYIACSFLERKLGRAITYSIQCNSIRELFNVKSNESLIVIFLAVLLFMDTADHVCGRIFQ